VIREFLADVEPGTTVALERWNLSPHVIRRRGTDGLLTLSVCSKEQVDTPVSRTEYAFRANEVLFVQRDATRSTRQ